LLLVLAAACICAALIGRKRAIEATIDAIDLGDLLSGIVDLIDV
jgi:hypothetical protein